MLPHTPQITEEASFFGYLIASAANASERGDILAPPYIRDVGIFSQFIAFIFSQEIFLTQLST